MNKVETFLQLVKENPTLRIIPLVDSEVVCDDSYSTWIGSFGACYMDEICTPEENAERFYFKSYEDELIDFLHDYYSDKQDTMSDEEFDKFIDGKLAEQVWEKVIVVYIDLPD